MHDACSHLLGKRTWAGGGDPVVCASKSISFFSSKLSCFTASDKLIGKLCLRSKFPRFHEKRWNSEDITMNFFSDIYILQSSKHHGIVLPCHQGDREYLNEILILGWYLHLRSSAPPVFGRIVDCPSHCGKWVCSWRCQIWKRVLIVSVHVAHREKRTHTQWVSTMHFFFEKSQSETGDAKKKTRVVSIKTEWQTQSLPIVHQSKRAMDFRIIGVVIFKQSPRRFL